MKLLWDTHVLIWVLTANPRLSAPARAALADPANDHFVSIASLWEIAVKLSIGKLQLHGISVLDLASRMQANATALLGVEPEDCRVLETLPFVHRDPFDRMLAAQSSRRGWTLLSADPVFDRYGIARLW